MFRSFNLTHIYKIILRKKIVYECISLPRECVLALRPKEVDMVLELQFEHMVLADGVALLGGGHCIAQQGEGGQGEVILGEATMTLL